MLNFFHNPRSCLIPIPRKIEMIPHKKIRGSFPAPRRLWLKGQVVCSNHLIGQVKISVAWRKLLVAHRIIPRDVYMIGRAIKGDKIPHVAVHAAAWVAGRACHQIIVDSFLIQKQLERA